MARLDGNPTLLNALHNNTPFIYAHLVKFERPALTSVPGSASTFSLNNAENFAYFSDGAFDIVFDDGTKNSAGVANGPQTYVANKLISIGSISDSTDVKTTSTNLVLDATPINTSFTGSLDVTATEIRGGISEPIGTFEELGFRVDDKIVISGYSGSELRITGFTSNGSASAMTYVNVGTTTQPTFNGQVKTITLKSEEITGLIHSSAIDKVSFMHRRVTIYKAFFYAESPHLFIGSPLELFNGTITNATFEEDPEKGTKVTWNLSNFLGDFRRVKGRLTSHESQQAFGSLARGDSRSSYVPEASRDRGFEHAEKSVSFLAPYTDFEKETKYKKKKILFGLLGSYKEPNGYNLIPVTREVDIRFDLQAKYLPVVYGVQRVKGIPVFADLDRDLTSTGSSSVYTANAICEGPIQSVMNVYVDDKALNCMSADDAITRNPFNSDSTDDQKAEAAKQDVYCRGTATEGLLITGSLPHSSFFQKQNNTHTQQTQANGDPANANNSNHSTSDYLTEQASNSAPAKDNVGVYDNSGLSLGVGGSGITHREAIKTPNGMAEMVMEFYMGLSDQPASTILASQAETTGNGGGGGFLLQEQLGLLNSPDGYWGQNHRLLDTAYAVNNFIVTAEESTIPSLDYVVSGKLLDCFNYDGSFMHSNLPIYSEDHANFKEGDSVKLDSTRAFTSTKVKLNSSGTIVLIGDGIGSGESQFIRTAGQEMLTTTIIDKFFYRDHEGTIHYRFRWDITAAEETLLREIGYFYMESGSNQWHMVTYDAQDIDTSSTITVAEIFEAEVSQTSTGAASFAGTLSNITAASGTISDYDLTDADALFFQANPDGVGADSYFSTSSPTIVNISGTTITASNTQSTTSLPSDAKVVLNQIRLSTSASDTDDIYNGKFIYFRRTTGDIGIVLHRKVIDYNGTTKIATLDNNFLEGRILPNDIITFSERQSEIPHNLSPLNGAFAGDLRPSTNFAMIALDYIKSNRYGLDIPLDKINITDFLLAATECDTQSDVTVQFNSAVTLVPGEVYRYISNGHEKWRGTVVHNYNAETQTYGGTGAEDNWLFTNVTGKLTNRYNNWQTRKVGDLIYQEGNNSVYIKTGSDAAQTAISNGASIATTVTLTKVSSGGGPASAQIKTTAWTNTAKPVTYSLYDSDDLPYWRYLGWPEPHQRYATRHQGNLTIDTAAPALDNLKGILQHFNGLLYHSNGKLRIKVGAGRAADGPESDANFNDSNIDVDVKVRYITDEDIIGKISIKDEGLNKAQNTISASVSDPALDFNDRSITFVNPEFKKEDRGLEKSANFAVPGITNYYNARLAAEQTLKFSRFSRYISFVMRPAGIAILPGELIRVKYPRFGWDVGSEVLFRVKTVSIAKDCLVSITAEEHDDSIYFISRNIRSPFFIDEIVRQKARIPGKPTMRTPQSASTPSPNIIRWNAATGVAERGGGYEVWRAENFSGDASIAVTAIPTAELVDTVGANQLELADLKTESPTSKSFIYWVRAFNDSVPQTSSGVRKAERRYYGDFNDDSDYGGVGQANAARLALKALEESITISFSTFGLTIPADEDGNNPDFSNINGQITVEIANTDITSQCTFSLANPVGFNQSATPPNFVVSAGGAYTITGITASTASIDVTAAIPANAVTGLSVATSVTKKFITTLSPKIKPRSIALGIPTAEYDENNASPNPASVTVTATAGGTVGTPFYEFRVDTGSGFSTVQNSTGNTISYSYPSSFSNVKNQQIHVKLREGSNSGEVLAQAFANPSATSKGNPGVAGNPGADAYTVRGSNENHTFVADTTGAVSMTGFSCDFTVRKGSTLYTYVASGNTAGTFKYGTITATNVIQVVNSSSGQITLAGGSAIASGLTVITGSLQVPIIDNENSVVITTVVITFSKSIKASRDGGIFTFEENTNSNITSTVAAAFAENTGQASTSFTNSAAQAAATAVIAASIDGFLRPNDRVTITDNSHNVAGTRIYTGTGTTNGGSVNTSDFSSLVVETFNGSVIVDGTLSADKLAANTTTTNTLNVGSNLVLANAGQFYTTNKTSYSDNDAGFFLGWDGSKHQLNLGNQTDYIKWDGSNLQVAGSIFFDNGNSIGLESFSNTNTGFTDDTAADAAQGDATEAKNKSQHFDENGDISLGINIGSQGHIRGGINAANSSGTGIFLGFKTGNTTTPKFSVGNLSGKRITWDGTDLTVVGTLKMVDGSTTTTLDNSNTLNSNTQASDVSGLGTAAVEDVGTIQSGTTADNVGLGNLNNNNFDSNGNMDAGKVGGWELTGSRIYSSGHSSTSLNANSGFLGSNGMVLRKEGAIHSKNFYVNENGNAGFKGAVTVTSLSFDNTNASNKVPAANTSGFATVATTGNYSDVGGTKPPSNATANRSDADTNTAISDAASGAVTTAGTNANNAAKTNGSVGGWNLENDRMYSGSNTAANTPLSASSGFISSGMVLRKEGAIHSSKFYVNENGDAAFAGNITSAGTVSADALVANSIDIAGKAVSGSVGFVGGISGQNSTDNNHDIRVTEAFSSAYGANGRPFHMAGFTETALANPDVIVNQVLGDENDHESNIPVPLFKFNFTTHNWGSGTRAFLVQTGIDFLGSTGSSSECDFAVAMRATTSATDFRQTSRSSYVFSDIISSSGSHAVGPHQLNAKVDLDPNTTYYIWCFGIGDDGVEDYKSGYINVFGINK